MALVKEAYDDIKEKLSPLELRGEQYFFEIIQCRNESVDSDLICIEVPHDKCMVFNEDSAQAFNKLLDAESQAFGSDKALSIGGSVEGFEGSFAENFRNRTNTIIEKAMGE